MIVLIPAFEPDGRLGELVAELRERRDDIAVVVVDDGSGPSFEHVFRAARSHGAEVLTHGRNRGKGRALATGFAHVQERSSGQDVVTADCDGQHRVDDVLAVARRLEEHGPGERPIVLGCRALVGAVPWRSRVGNAMSGVAFRLLTGTRLRDTQTGLRAYPTELLEWLRRIPGDRFEYELEVLLAAHRDGVAVVEEPIATVYLDGNASTHFDPVRDSMRVYSRFVRHGIGSVRAWLGSTRRRTSDLSHDSHRRRPVERPDPS